MTEGEVLAQALAQAAAWQARAERLVSVLRMIQGVTYCEHLDMGGEEKSRYAFAPARGKRADRAIKEVNQAEREASPEPSKLLEVARVAVNRNDLELEEAVGALTPEEKAAITGEKP